jgi:HJR/Mrr/RecB family endonuclease
MPYIIPAYIFVVENPIFLIPACMGIALIIGAVYWYIRKKKQERYMAIQKFSEIMKLDWREFEEFVAEVLKQKGFHTIL